MRFLWPKFSHSLDAINRNAQMWQVIRSYERAGIGRCASRYALYALLNSR